MRKLVRDPRVDPKPKDVVEISSGALTGRRVKVVEVKDTQDAYEGIKVFWRWVPFQAPIRVYAIKLLAWRKRHARSAVVSLEGRGLDAPGTYQ